ncbi:carbon starvation protein A [Candidatus Poribacteria bacterium]|nr:carbon starvation protein A [Candidatus Poribacteria bacterium]
MNAIFIAVVALGSFYMAYKFYGGFLSKKIFKLSPENIPPSHEFEDGMDFVPTEKKILWGHHFTSIAGAAPIVGPAIGVIWGWLPATLWVILGTIFMGAVHDLGALVISVRHKGESIGELTRNIIGNRAGKLFLLVILFLVWIVIAVFALIIAILFDKFPATVIPIWTEMILALFVGFSIYRLKWGATIPSLIALLIMYFSIWLGSVYPIQMPDTFLGSGLVTWIWIVCIYAYIASILPVWTLLQPRDYINAEELIVGLVLLYAGMFVVHPKIVAPAVRLAPEGAPWLVPFLFITIACGAISGFHCLVCSGTTVRQLNNEKDSQMVGYGGMITEGVLAIIAVLACVAGFATRAEWSKHYASWGAAQGLSAKLSAFVLGGTRFISGLGIPEAFSQAIIGVIIVSFAMTTIDTAARLQRYVISELGGQYRMNFLKNRYLGGAIAVGSGLALCLAKSGGMGGMTLWPIFGTSNQLLAGLALLVITIWLLKIQKPISYTLLPMIFMMIITLWAMGWNIVNFWNKGDWLLVSVASVLFILALWLIGEAYLALKNRKIESAV